MVVDGYINSYATLGALDKSLEVAASSKDAEEKK